jgi:hypothetical protein
MTNGLSRQLLLAVFAVTTLAAGWVILAQPVRDRIIDDAVIEPRAGHVFLEVSLTLPFRYLSHVPLDTGRELRIRIQPVQVSSSDRDAVFKREAVVPPDADVAAVDQVVYEGDAPDGPWLTVRFTRPVRYQVIPGADYRSVIVEIQELLP